MAPRPPTRGAREQRPALGSSPDAQLALAGLTIGLIFGLALILPLPFWRAQPAGPAPASQAAASGDMGWAGVLLAVGFALALCLPYRPYLLAVRSAAAVSTRALRLFTAALALVALLIYPAFGSDLFVYLDYERMWTVYGANPLLAAPALHPEDWAYPFVWIPQQPNPYGPLWPLLTWPIARLAADSLWGWIAGYKLLSLASYVMCCGLIWACVEPDRRARALVLFAWSPLVLFEVLGKAHNDGLLALSALATVWFARRQHPAAGLVAATAGTLVKVSGFPAGLAVMLMLGRARAWRPLALGLVAAAATTIGLFAPFWAGPATLAPVLVQTSRVVWSPGALMISALGPLLPNADTVARFICAAVWLGVVAMVARRGGHLAIDGAILFLATLLLLTTAFFAHYLVPVIALAAVAGNRRLERFTLTLSIGALAAYSVELLGSALPPGWIGSPGYQALGSLVLLAPSAVLLLPSGLPRWGLEGRRGAQG